MADWWWPGPPPAGLAELVTGLTYRPGWTFHLEVHATTITPAAWHLVVRAHVQNTDRPQDWVTVLHVMRMPVTEPEDGWAALLLRALSDIEKHEAAEWFRVDGVKLFDPHADRAPNQDGSMLGVPSS